MPRLQVKAGGYCLAAFLIVGGVNSFTHVLTGEDATGQSAPANEASVTQTSGSWRKPTESGSLGTPYHQPGGMWASGYHTGIDFPVPTGTAVRAAGAGKVITAGWAGPYGNQVVIRHSDGVFTQYAHLSRIDTAVGAEIDAGQEIGRSGNTGNSSGPHLHFEVRTGPEYGSDIDPVAFLDKHGVNL